MKYLLALFICASLVLDLNKNTNAQTIGISAQINHLSDGILATYSPNWNNKNWNIDVGLRFMINTQKFNDNTEGHVYFQNGYAKSFYERFSLNARVYRRLFTYRFLKLSLMSNALVSWHGLLEKEYHFPIFDSSGLYSHSIYEEIYTKPALSLEVTIGLALDVNLSSRISLNASMGFGYIIMDYSHWSTATISNYPVYNAPNNNWKRGDTEWVGTDVIPMLSFGIKYKLK